MRNPYPDFVWFIGQVEDTSGDPLQQGRVRVRIFGVHPGADILEKENLPFAPVLDGGVSRISNNQMVLGFFMDGEEAQQPFILGVIGGSRQSVSGSFFNSFARVTNYVYNAAGSIVSMLGKVEPFKGPFSPGSIVKVVDAGKGYTTVQYDDGRIEKRTGARNWRNNNPGNIEYGEFATSYGAVGTDGRFAVFPTYEMGRKAKEALLFNGKRYAGLSIEKAISRYAPPVENNTNQYINSISGALGVSPSTPLSSLSSEQRITMLNSMEKVEGFKVGTTQILSGPTG